MPKNVSAQQTRNLTFTSRNCYLSRHLLPFTTTSRHFHATRYHILETSKMAQNTSYPSPTSAQMGDGPFYTRQNQLPVSADAQISPQMPPRAPPAAMVRDSTADENAQKAQIAQNAQNLRHPQLPSSEELARHTLEHQYDQMSESARKRTKVSRACDECRRKKVPPVTIINNFLHVAL